MGVLVAASQNVQKTCRGYSRKRHLRAQEGALILVFPGVWGFGGPGIPAPRNCGRRHVRTASFVDDLRLIDDLGS